MDSLYILIPIALIFVGIAVKVFLWAVDSDQFDDLDVEAQRILFDDDVSTDATTEHLGKPIDSNHTPCSEEPKQNRE